MPPKCKFTREQIVEAALQVVRKSGPEALTARALASELGSSAKPVFGLFQNMEQVQAEVLAAADRLYQSYLQQDMAEGKYPPYKASGMAYIRFAREEKALFKLLFMRDRTGEEIGDDRESIRPILDIIRKELNISQEEAVLFHLEMWLYTHGIATMIATSYLEWDMAFVSKALTDVYQGLKHRYGENREAGK